MADTLLGKERSGTPLETRGGTEDLAAMLQAMMRGGPAGTERHFGRLGSDAFASLLGAGGVDFAPAVQAAIGDPRDQVAGLFSAMKPFEARAREELTGTVRNRFGQMGGRFSRNLAESENQALGELNRNLSRGREEALITAAGQRNQALAQLLGLAQGSRQQSMLPLQLMSQFFAPGPMVFQEGVLGDLIGAAGQAAAAHFGVPPGTAPTPS